VLFLQETYNGANGVTGDDAVEALEFPTALIAITENV
jgi:hypothetical protein